MSCTQVQCCMEVMHDERSKTAAVVSASVSINIHTIKKNFPKFTMINELRKQHSLNCITVNKTGTKVRATVDNSRNKMKGCSGQ